MSKVQHVVITGASSGIGAATAEAFAERGAKLVLAARNGEALDEIAERCRALGGEVLTQPTDITVAAAVEALAKRAHDWLGHIDLWFSNVGVGVVGKFHEVPIASHRQVIEANLIGHLNDAHAVLPIFLAQERGILVNMISVGGFLPAPWAVAYTASKFGLRGMSEALRGEVSPYPNIHICDVYPTFVDTPAIAHAGNHTGGRTSVPPGVLDPRTVARVVVRLADHPRNTTAVGAPAAVMKLAQFLTPNVSATLMNAFMSRYFARAEPARPTEGNLFTPPDDDGVIDGGFRNPAERRTAAVAAGGLGALALLAGGWMLTRRRAREEAAGAPPSDRRVTTGWKLDRQDRARLLAQFPPRFSDVVADHVTLRSGTDATTPLPPHTAAEVVGEADDGAGVQALVVRVGGTIVRADGGTYHITWSLDRAAGRRAVESNDVIARLGFRSLSEPVPIRLHPSRL